MAGTQIIDGPIHNEQTVNIVVVKDSTDMKVVTSEMSLGFTFLKLYDCSHF
jgi:hypothetical protein